MLQDELISAYKIEYNQTFISKDKEFERHRLLTRSIRTTSVTTRSISATKMVKVTKNRLNEIKNVVIEAKNNKLKTSVGKKIIMVNSIGQLIKGIASIKF